MTRRSRAIRSASSPKTCRAAQLHPQHVVAKAAVEADLISRPHAFDDKRVVAAGPHPFEQIHAVAVGQCDVEERELVRALAEAFLRHGATANDMAELLYNYPTLSDLYRHAALKAIVEHRRRGEGA